MLIRALLAIPFLLASQAFAYIARMLMDVGLWIEHDVEVDRG